jgi:hypothetical protein
VRAATAAAGVLAVAAAAMVALAVATGGDGDERAAAPPTATPAAPAAGGDRDGLAVWAAQGCGSCHALAAANAHGDIGPDLDENLDGVPASFIRDSIVAPDKAIAAGYSGGMMPADYRLRIAPDDLDRLVSFLRASASR